MSAPTSPAVPAPSPDEPGVSRALSALRSLGCRSVADLDRSSIILPGQARPAGSG